MNEEPKFLGQQGEGKAVTLDCLEVVHRAGLCRAWGVPSREDLEERGYVERRGPGGAMTKKWFSVAEVAEMLGFGETKVRMAIIHGDLRSVKDGRQRRILPQWVDEYVALRVAESDQDLA